MIFAIIFEVIGPNLRNRFSKKKKCESLQEHYYECEKNVCST